MLYIGRRSAALDGFEEAHDDIQNGPALFERDTDWHSIHPEKREERI
jgi:hypothetical protein